MTRCIITTIDEAERLIEEMHSTVHAGQPVHRKVNAAVRKAFAGAICNDVFLTETKTLRTLVDHFEINHVTREL